LSAQNTRIRREEQEQEGGNSGHVDNLIVISTLV